MEEEVNVSRERGGGEEVVEGTAASSIGIAHSHVQSLRDTNTTACISFSFSFSFSFLFPLLFFSF